MQAGFIRAVSVIGVSVVLALATLWLMKRTSDNIVPIEYRGVWHDQGAECSDANAQFRISASTLDYDDLSFKADGVSERVADDVTITGVAFPNGRETQESVHLLLRDHRTKLFVVLPGPIRQGPFVRCFG